jgi:hypothetical protein
MKNVVYYYNSVVGEHKNDRGNTVGTLRIGDVIERRAHRRNISGVVRDHAAAAAGSFPSPPKLA